MKPHTVILASLCALALVASGCMDSPSRDIDREAKERQEWAQKNNDHDVIAVLTGPNQIAPGALVWYSAYGSHDPDFLGATTADLRDDEPASEGKVRYEDDASNIHFSWYVPMQERKNDDLGTGIRAYEWQVDNGPVLHSFDLTHRYGSEDGPVRFPVGFPEPGEHTVRLTVVGWDGSRDSAKIDVTVSEGGTGSTVNGWQVTEEGWAHQRWTELEPFHYGECPPLQSTYDAPTHHVKTPWDLIYWMDEVRVVAQWDVVTEPLPIPGLDVNIDEVAVTLGHCAQDGAWARFDDDQGFDQAHPRLEGSVGGGEFVQNLETQGKRTEKTGAWDWNAYFSDSGTYRAGLYTEVDVDFVFVPATDTHAGGL